MSDAILLALGLLGGAATLVLGAPVSLVLPLVPALAAGIHDGRTHRRLRSVRSWAPALAGALLVPAWAIGRDALRDPPAPDGGLALSVGLALVGAFALAFVSVTLVASALTRALTKRAGASHP